MSDYRCCICAKRWSETGCWQHWFRDPFFALCFHRNIFEQINWEARDLCYVEWGDSRGFRDIERLWFHICNPCLMALFCNQWPIYGGPSESECSGRSSSAGRWSHHFWGCRGVFLWTLTFSLKIGIMQCTTTWDFTCSDVANNFRFDGLSWGPQYWKPLCHRTPASSRSSSLLFISFPDPDRTVVGLTVSRHESLHWWSMSN